MKRQPQGKPRESKAPKLPKIEQAVWPNVKSIPVHEHLFGPHFVRGYASATVAPGATGKSSLATTEALMMVCGSGLLGPVPPRPLNVLYVNLEVDRDQIWRHFFGAMNAFDGLQIEGKLFIHAGTDGSIKIEEKKGTSGFNLWTELVDELIGSACRTRSTW